MAKFIRFKDAAADQHAFPIESITAAYVTALTTIIVYVKAKDSGSGVADSLLTITVTSGKQEEVLNEILKGAVKIDSPVFEVSASHEFITTVAFTEGS